MNNTSESPIAFAVIGGSGLYAMPGLTDVREVNIATPFGDPSDAIVIGTLAGKLEAHLRSSVDFQGDSIGLFVQLEHR